jgi:hypothetical protein
VSNPEERPFVDLNAFVNAEVWLDPQFKSELESDPNAAMQRLAEKHGLELPEGVNYQVVANTEQTQHIVLWPTPSGDSPADLESEVQGFASSFQPIGGLDAGGSTSWGTTSYVCTSMYTTCSHFCPKRISSAG